jgi:hypothetical protein
MNDASRDAFEAKFAYLSSASLVRNDDGYMANQTSFAWAIWKASRKQALSEYEAKLQTELDNAVINDHRMAAPFGRVQSEPCARAGSIEAVIEFMNGKV